MTRHVAPTCDVCSNGGAVVMVSDTDGTERQVCTDCWHRLDRVMDLTVVRFAAPLGTRTAP